ncbi:DinB family protein [Actinoplanes sp. N902-109]|uniref:DinB family protein n=1 Tax=Actinoplanes sp. (strain N902-109) TaxID=649831 RepID=UPI000329378C|nr:DinB family protein [Actinoplanes sp. N902-109]AGL18537.1 pentapeptide repeat-containing protein [Actinoplanes sp. N902-109]
MAVVHDFTGANLAGARFRNVDLSGAVMRGVYASTLELDGAFDRLTVNEVDVMPLVEAELDRRYPERPKMRPQTAAQHREAWEILERLWWQTGERARRLPPARLHERVDGEWSFIETLRHLVFATDAWINRALLGEPFPFHPLGLPHEEMPPAHGVPNDPAARPSLDEILAVRADRTATVRGVLDGLTDERLTEMTEPVPEPGYPPSTSYPVRRCLSAVITEEWQHRLFAERDLDALQRPQR